MVVLHEKAQLMMKTVVVEIKADEWIIDDLVSAIKDGRLIDLELVGGHGKNRKWLGTVRMNEKGD